LIHLKEWKNRRRACIDMVDTISESMEKPRKVFFEEVGLEDDGDFGLDINKFPATSGI
jgi:hypothetical protein